MKEIKLARGGFQIYLDRSISDVILSSIEPRIAANCGRQSRSARKVLHREKGRLGQRANITRLDLPVSPD
jgi:hypothetical protein